MSAKPGSRLYRIAFPLLSAWLLAALAVVLVGAMAVLAHGPAQSPSRSAEAALVLTPSSGVATTTATSECAGGSCATVRFSVRYSYSRANGDGACGRLAYLTWDGEAIGSAEVEKSAAGCIVEGASFAARHPAGDARLARGSHRVCVTAPGGGRSSAHEACATFNLTPLGVAPRSPSPREPAATTARPSARPTAPPTTPHASPPVSAPPSAPTPRALPTPRPTPRPTATPKPEASATPPGSNPTPSPSGGLIGVVPPPATLPPSAPPQAPAEPTAVPSPTNAAPAPPAPSIATPAPAGIRPAPGASASAQPKPVTQTDALPEERVVVGLVTLFGGLFAATVAWVAIAARTTARRRW